MGNSGFNADGTRYGKYAGMVNELKPCGKKTKKGFTFDVQKEMQSDGTMIFVWYSYAVPIAYALRYPIANDKCEIEDSLKNSVIYMTSAKYSQTTTLHCSTVRSLGSIVQPMAQSDIDNNVRSFGFCSRRDF
jgi:hypothetical protein